MLSFKPNSVQAIDFSNYSNKDNYPICTFQYNSLGFRDIEPDLLAKGKHKILVIGDSYIWGEGIATNKQTIVSYLRNDLNKLSANKYEIISAAFPGLALVGYFNYFKKIKSYVRPELVLIGYLGDSDLCPFDFQFLVDKIPSNYFFKNLIINFHIIQAVHQTSIIHSQTLWFSKEAIANVQKIFQNFADYSRKENLKIILINYYSINNTKVPDEIGILNLPDFLKYPGKRNKYWYAKSYHPKPIFNKVLAKILAEKIVIYFEKDNKNIFNNLNKKIIN